jgi:hypothetical protein
VRSFLLRCKLPNIRDHVGASQTWTMAAKMHLPENRQVKAGMAEVSLSFYLRGCAIIKRLPKEEGATRRVGWREA